MRALFLVAGLVLAFIILSPMLRGWRPRLLGGGDRPDQLVKDPFCGTYVLRSRAFRRESGPLREGRAPRLTSRGRP